MNLGQLIGEKNLRIAQLEDRLPGSPVPTGDSADELRQLKAQVAAYQLEITGARAQIERLTEQNRELRRALQDAEEKNLRLKAAAAAHAPAVVAAEPGTAEATRRKGLRAGSAASDIFAFLNGLSAPVRVAAIHKAFPLRSKSLITYSMVMLERGGYIKKSGARRSYVYSVARDDETHERESANVN